MRFLTNMLLLSALSGFTMSVSIPDAAQAASVLFVDDDAGLAGQTTWLSTLTGLGISYDYEALSTSGNPTSNLANYDIVIWSVGDRAYTNLTTTNVSVLQSYLNGGGSLLYSGGHNLYSEPNVGSFAAGYLGVSSYSGNMPTFSATTMSGTGHPATGSTVYGVQVWGGGQYGNMMSGFSVTSAQPMLYNPAATSGGPYVAAVHTTGTYSAMTWGFDLNHLASQGQRDQLLGDSLSILAVPEPSTALLLGLGLAAIGARRRA